MSNKNSKTKLNKQLELVKRVYSCAREYHNNLEKKQVMFIYGDLHSPEFFEVEFFNSNFQHLTGIDNANNTGAIDFYKKALNKSLSIDNLLFDNISVIENKLYVLPQLVKIDKTARMVGDYNNNGFHLQTDKLAGGVSACLGFRKEEEKKYYYPNTAIKVDIRSCVLDAKRILLILKKNVGKELYQEITYLSKGITSCDINYTQDLLDKIDHKLCRILTNKK